MDLDSGADVNIMDEYQFKALVHRTSINPMLEKTNISLSTLQNKLQIKGEFHTIIRRKTRGVPARVIVIKGKMKSLPLLSRKTMVELGMLEIRPDGSLLTMNDLRMHESMVKSTNIADNEETSIKEIVNRHTNIFEGIGRIRDLKNDKDLYAKYNMKPGVVPVAQKPRPVAYYLQEPLKK
ncbi:hypothetical protein LOTGIDRAFT_175011 [Lottia gigantea]|uniref:Uncharacterized protein n=1 Tax=Lottia gigantea TaxID=225164 RepID=V4AMG9_LOTGI|nr:hypothetical protein LOTGIDRAFT_175011 [Lottia gigantea]ESO95955.1 hypothetical protein LOTGIDRAFT_175011 [Lottia gigantea]